MGRGRKLLCDGHYDEAIEQLRKDAPRDWQDDFRVGAILHLGIALLLAGRLAEAQAHLDGIISECRWRVSVHYIYAGLIRWLRRKHKDAVEMWLAGRKAQYSGYSGLDVPFVLYFAALRDPKVFELTEAASLIRTERPHASLDGYPGRFADYLLGELPEEQFVKRMHNVKPGPGVKVARLEAAALTDYYIGLARLRDGDKRAFREHFGKCTEITGFLNIYTEFVFAKCEMRNTKARSAM